MINLVSPEQKRDIKAARTNVVLVHYSVALLLLSVTVGLVYGGGFWLVMQDKHAVEDKLTSQSDSSKTYKSIEAQATSFRSNLTVAKQILSKETSYSTFLTTLAKDLPDGTVVSSLDLGADAVTVAKNGLTIQARASDYTTALALKSALEKSVLFENVNIVNVTRPDDISKLSGQEATYPYSVTINAKLSQKSGQDHERFSLSPSVSVSIALYALIALLIGGTGYGMYFMQSKLSNFATSVDHLKIDSEINDQTLSNSLKLKKALQDNDESVKRAASIVADSKYYEYQNQIVQDVNAYAGAAGITVLSYSFTNSSASAVKSPNAVSGLKTVTATVSLKNPINYADYIKFLKLIEKNLTKMQVSQINLTTDVKNPGTINSPSLTLEVYTR